MNRFLQCMVTGVLIGIALAVIAPSLSSIQTGLVVFSVLFINGLVEAFT